MNRLRVTPIVEGHGEDKGAIRILLRRLWERFGDGYIDIAKPVRHPRGKLVKREGIHAAVEQAIKVLARPPEWRDATLILILVDADNDCPAELGPRMLSWAREIDHRIEISCVVANVEFETWFVAAAESLTDFLDLSRGENPADDPEAQRLSEKWIQKRFCGKGWNNLPGSSRQPLRYTKTQDQPRLTERMDLDLCLTRSRSFRKLHGDLKQCFDRVKSE